MLPSVESLNLADADVGQRMGRTSCSRSVERFCYFSLMVSREVLWPQHPRAQHPSFLFLPFALESQSYSGLQPCVAGVLYFVNAVTFVYVAFVPYCGKWKGGLYEGS